MDYLVIKYERLMHHLDYDVRKSARGVMNWFVDENNLLNVLLHLQGVNYVYRVFANETPEELKLVLTSQTQILGVLDIEQEEEEEEVLPVLTFEEVFNVGSLK